MTEAIVRLDTSATFASLLERIEALEERVVSHEEVRTQRLVVVDEHGEPRIVVEVLPGGVASLRLYYQSPDESSDVDDGRAIELSARMEGASDYLAAVTLSPPDNCDVAMVEILATQEPKFAPTSAVTTFQHVPES